MMIKVSNETPGVGGSTDVMSGTYMGLAVAVKTLKVTTQDGLQKMRKVRSDGYFGHDLNQSTPAIL